MATATRIMTVEEFSKLPETGGGFFRELRHGQVVEVTRPKWKHHRIQDRLLKHFIRAGCGESSTIELAFRAVPEHDLRIADVAYVSPERWKQIDLDGYLNGAPDLTIEVLSPSNTADEIFEKEKLCLENGCLDFWVVDPDRRQVKVSTPDGHTMTYRAGQTISLANFGGTSIAVNSIFG